MFSHQWSAQVPIIAESMALTSHGLAVGTKLQRKGKLQSISTQTGDLQWEIENSGVQTNLVVLGDSLAAGLSDQSVVLVRASNGEVIQNVSLDAVATTLTPFPDLALAIGDAQGNVYLWEKGGHQARKIACFADPISEIDALPQQRLACRTSEEAMYVLSIATAKILWNHQLSMFSYGEWIVINEILFTPYHSDIAAIDLRSGKLRIVYTGARELTSGLLSLDDGALVFAVPDYIRCIDATTGKVRWETPTPDIVYAVMQRLDSTLVAAQCHDGSLLAIDCRDGNIASQNKTSSGLEVSILSPDGVLYCLHSGQIVSTHQFNQ